MNSPFKMNSLGDDYRTLVIGASGALRSAFSELLNQDPGCAYVRELGRNSFPFLDPEDPDSIARAASELTEEAPYQLILHAAGLLHRDEIKPEKSYSAIDADTLQSVFQVNTIGPALVLSHFLPLLDPHGAMAMLSAKVGSISHNRLGGWYAYRASKVALNMLIKTAAIELARTRPQIRLLSLHPGTVFRAFHTPFVVPLKPGRQALLPMSCYL
jgi:NAD(P)-dependent dehydrogenase (short-subunit alcohol dehydrogenase family)